MSLYLQCYCECRCLWRKEQILQAAVTHPTWIWEPNLPDLVQFLWNSALHIKTILWTFPFLLIFRNLIIYVTFTSRTPPQVYSHRVMILVLILVGAGKKRGTSFLYSFQVKSRPPTILFYLTAQPPQTRFGFKPESLGTLWHLVLMTRGPGTEHLGSVLQSEPTAAFLHQLLL